MRIDHVGHDALIQSGTCAKALVFCLQSIVALLHNSIDIFLKKHGCWESEQLKVNCVKN